MLSGFLMSGALNRRYGINRSGVSAFLVSRALRLLPMYWLAILSSALLILISGRPSDALLVNTDLKIPETTSQWISNLLIMGQTTFGIGRSSALLSPSSWAVEVEILMYFCSCIILARSRQLATGAFVLLLAGYPFLWWHARELVKIGEATLGSQLLYSFLPAALLPYSIGTLMWFNRHRFKSFGLRELLVGIAGLVGCTIAIHPFSVTLAYVLALPSLVAILGALMFWPRSSLLERIDTFLGQMSYPIYLTQWSCAFAFVLVIPRSWGLHYVDGTHYAYTSLGFTCILALSIAVGAVLAWFVEAPLERRRHSMLSAYFPAVKRQALGLERRV